MSEAYTPPSPLPGNPGAAPAANGHRKRTALIVFTVVTLVIVALVFVFVDHALANGIFNDGTGNCGGG